MRQKAAYITPVPGGIGPITVTMLLENIVTAAERQTQGISVPVEPEALAQ